MSVEPRVLMWQPKDVSAVATAKVRFDQVRRSLAAGGWQALGSAAKTFVAQRVLGARPDFAQHRYLLSDRLARALNNTVRYGPFQHLKLHQTPYWSGADRGAMLLGMYEQEVLQQLQQLSHDYDTFIDVGAADGYYAVGALVSDQFQSCICFETDVRGQEAIQRLADLNNVSKRIHIFGQANSEFLSTLSSTGFDFASGGVFLFDIEGAEYSLLTDSLLQTLRNSAMIIELHDSSDEPGSKNADLFMRVARYFNQHVVTFGARDPNLFPELADWTDDDRWILCSESRAGLMKWLILTPTTSLN